MEAEAEGADQSMAIKPCAERSVTRRPSSYTPIIFLLLSHTQNFRMSHKLIDLFESPWQTPRQTGTQPTRFEMARIVALRCAQLQSGAAPLCTPPEGYEGRSWELYRVCHEELRRSLLPVRIGRPQTDGTMLWLRLQDMDIDPRAFVQPHYKHGAPGGVI